MSRPVAVFVRVVCVSALLGSAVVLAAASEAAARTAISSRGSIVFARDHDIWLTSPDGRTKRPLTTDGTAGAPYRSPTQSRDGKVVVAVRDRGEPGMIVSSLYVMNRKGRLLKAPFEPPQYVAGGSEVNSCTGYGDHPDGIVAAVSPDGRKIAVDKLGRFSFAVGCGVVGVGGTSESQVYVINRDGSPANDVIRPDSGVPALALRGPAWVSNSRLLLYADIFRVVYYYDLGSDLAVKWFGQTETTDGAQAYPALSGKLLATSGTAGTDHDFSYGYRVRLWTTNGPIPAPPTPRCDIINPSHRNYDSSFEIVAPTLAPDGTGVAWIEIDRDGNGAVTATSIYISPIGHIAGGYCSSTKRRLLIHRGTDPDWGPAPVGPAGSSRTLPLCPLRQTGTPPDCKRKPSRG